MLITVLAENSHIRAVGFEGEEIRFHASVQTEPRQTSDYYILMLTQLFTLYGVSGERITGVVLASVVPQLTPTLIDALARIAGSRHKLLSLSSGIKTGLNIRSDQPQQVGAELRSGGRRRQGARQSAVRGRGLRMRNNLHRAR